MKQLVLKTMQVVAVLPLICSRVCSVPAVATPEPTVAKVSWWQQVISATHALVAQNWNEDPARDSGKMPAVKNKLRQRAENANQKATTGQVTARDLFPKIPNGVLLVGEKATLEFLDNRHLSHVQSAKLHPELAASPNNLVFELPKWNLARGPNDMGLLDKLKVSIHNAVTGVSAARPVILGSMMKGGLIGVMIELPVTGMVEALHVVNERKTLEEAVHDGAKAVSVAGLAGGAAAGAMAAASTLGFTVGAPVLVTIAVVGGTAYVWVSGDRIWRALDDKTRTSIKAQLDAVQKGIQDHVLAMQDQIRTTTDAVHERIQWGSAYIKVNLLNQRGSETVIHRGPDPPPFNAENSGIAGSSPYYAPPMSPPVPSPPMLTQWEAIMALLRPSDTGR